MAGGKLYLPVTGYSHRQGGYKSYLRYKKRSGVSKKVRSYVKKELRSYDRNQDPRIFFSNAVSTGVDTTPVIQALTSNTQIPKGTDDYMRLGDQFTVNEVRWKLYLSEGDSTNYVRVIFVRSTEAGYAPTTADVFYDPGGTLQYWRCMLNIYKKGSRFSVISDKTYNLETNDISTLITEGRFRFKKGLRLQYWPAASSSIPKNCIYAIVVSDSGAIPNPTVKLDVEIKFTP